MILSRPVFGAGLGGGGGGTSLNGKVRAAGAACDGDLLKGIVDGGSGGVRSGLR